jgi:hypothetical protein
MKYSLPAALHFLAMILVIPGCSLPKRGMIDTHQYSSTQSPNIKVSVHGDFIYQKGKNGKFRHQFLDHEKHRLVYLHHIPHRPDDNRICSFHDPSRWIYASSSDNVEIERFVTTMAGEKWYGQDFVKHASTVTCLMVRKLSTYTARHDLFHVLYLWEMPPYLCKEWSSAEVLNEAQQRYLEKFRKGFASDIVIEEYEEKE